MTPTQPKPLTLAVLICTFRRPDDLLRCLHALTRQTRPPDDVLLVVREEDRLTRDALAHLPPDAAPAFRIVPVATPGLAAARNAGLDACTSDLLAMTDDDTAPHPDWIERIVAHFAADPSLGGVGGRDRCLRDGVWDDTRQPRVGELQWFGRMVGYHHLGSGPPRPVHILKGANMSWRLRAVGDLRVDHRLRGRGAQPHEDSAFGLAVRRRGYTLLYDPAVLVDHFEGARDEDRHYAGILPVRDAQAFREGPYNWVVALWDEFRWPRHLVFVVWNLLVGTRVAPGLVQAIRFTPALGVASWHRFWLTQLATLDAYRTLSRSSAPRQTAPQPAHPDPISARGAR